MMKLVDPQRNNKIKLLHVEAGRNLYGGAQQVVYLLQGLRPYPVENILVCPTGSEIAGPAEDMAHVVPIKMDGDLDIGLVYRLIKVIKEYKPDVLHVHSRRGADLFAAIAARKTGVPAIFSRRVDNPEKAWFARWKYLHYKKVVCISEGIARVVRTTQYPSNRIQTIHSAVDTQKFQPGGNQQWFRDTFDVRKDELVIANFAQMISRKRQQLLIEVFAELCEQYSQLKLLLFGKGPLLEKYKQQVVTLGLQDKVLFPGFFRAVEKVMPVVDIVAHPASQEGLGVALLQAAACARPIIATAVGGIPEIVRDGENGLLIEVDDAPALKRALCKLVEDRELQRQMGEKGMEIANRNFSIATMAQKNYLNYLAFR